MYLTDVDHSKYRKADKSLTSFQSNVVASVIMLPVIMCLLGVFMALHGFIIPVRVIPLVVCIVCVVVAYEGFQSALLSVVCLGGYESLKFKFKWRSLALTCSCSELLTKREYLTVVMLPFVLTVLLSYIISLCFANVELLIVSMLMALGAGGDVYNALRMLGEPAGILVEDHPDYIGSIVYYPVEVIRNA